MRNQEEGVCVCVCACVTRKKASTKRSKSRVGGFSHTPRLRENGWEEAQGRGAAEGGRAGGFGGKFGEEGAGADDGTIWVWLSGLIQTESKDGGGHTD